MLTTPRGALALAFSTGVTYSEAFGSLTSDWTLPLQGVWSRDLDTYLGSAQEARCPITRSGREPQENTAHTLYGASSKRCAIPPHNSPPSVGDDPGKEAPAIRKLHAARVTRTTSEPCEHSFPILRKVGKTS